MDVEMTVDLDEVEKFIERDNFTQFLLNNTTDFAVAAFILDSVIQRINDLREQEPED